MGSYDLDAARERRAAARAESGVEGQEFTFGGETFALPLELPLETAELLMFGRPSAFARALLGGDDWERFAAHKPTIDDLRDLADGMAVLYGFVDAGESAASSGSSTTTSSPSRPTSNASTASRSQRRATGRTTAKKPSRSAG